MRQKLTFVLELTQRCNNNCQYCYNVWKADPDYPSQEMSAENWKTVIDKISAESKLRQIALSGGEPTLHPGFFDILEHLQTKHAYLTLITNGTTLTPHVITRCIKLGIKTFEVPLLADTAVLHDQLTRHSGSWNKVIASCREIKKQKGSLAIVFVLTKLNIQQAQETMEMAIALGADAILANRFNPGGEGLKNHKLLTPSVAELQLAYRTIDDLAEKYEIPVTSGIPVPPCVMDPSAYQHIRFSYCPHGGKFTYFAIDPIGNLRPCNHSATILGNLINQKLTSILSGKTWREYFAGAPAKCTGCELNEECRGGCRAAAEVFYHDRTAQDPFIADNFKSIV